MRFALTTLAACFLGSTAFAADLPSRPPLKEAPYSFTGCYLGVQGGYGTASVKFGGRTIYDQSDWLAGGHLGCNRQWGNVVLGLETDLMRGGWEELGWVGSTALRAGVVIGDRLLAYGWAGVVYGRLASTLADTSFTGWRAGGGLEYAFTSHLSARAEYRYMDLAVNSVFPHALVHAGLVGLSLKF